MAEQRPVRMCDSCGGVDDHPRHTFVYAPGDAETDQEVGKKALRAAGDEHYDVIYAQVVDNSTVVRHLDCCRDAGCPDGTCDELLANADGKKGLDLAEYLTSLREN